MEQMKEELGQRQKVELGLDLVGWHWEIFDGNELAPSLATLETRGVEVLA